MKRNKKIRLNVKRIVNNILFLFVSIVIIVVATSSVSAKKEFTTTELRVNNSDTLWAIAGNISSNSADQNIQQIIYDIKEVNGLKNSDIYVGQVLQIPIY